MTLPVKESVREVARIFEGTHLEDMSATFQKFLRYSFYHSRSIEATAAISAVDIACFDLLGKSLGAPIHRLFGGGVQRSLPAYANGWYSDCTDAEDFATKAKAIVRLGFRALKFDPFHDQYGVLSAAGLEDASGRVRAVREAVGKGIDILIEFHGRFYPDAAIRAGRELDAYNPRFMEEPILPELSDRLFGFRRQVRTPVALGERLTTPADFASFLSRGLVDIVQPDITNSGGFTHGREIVAVADSFGALVAYHNAFGPVQTAATLQLDATIPNFLLQESFETSWPPWKKSLVRGYSLEGGQFNVPVGPGLGIEVNEGAVDEFRSEAMEPIGPEPPWVVAGTWTKRGEKPPRRR